MIDNDYLSSLLGQNAHRFAANWVVQLQGEHQGQPVCSIIGVLLGEARHPVTRGQDFQQEVQTGELILRIGNRYTDGNHVGAGLSGLITNHAHPADWRYEIKNGVLVPNELYNRR